MASATRSHSQRTSGYGIDIFKPVLNTKNELLELIQQIETQNKPLVTELRTKIYQAMKPTTADVQDDINTGLDEVEAWFRQLRKLLEDLASQEERRNKLKERLRRQAEESLDLAAQGLLFKCTIENYASVSTRPPVLDTPAIGDRNDSASTTIATAGGSETRSHLNTPTAERPSELSMTEAPSTLRKRPAPEDINTSCSSQRHRTILFKDLEQGEEAYKHRILREVYTNPSDRTVSGSFWILKCDLHNRHFCAKSDVGNKKSAEKHLPEHRDGYKSSSASRTRVFECFGFAVKGCEDHQVLEYNRRVEANIAERLHEKKTQRRSGRQRWTVTDTRDSSTEVAQVNHSGTFVENPEPGQLYIVLWRSKKERTKRPFAGLMLPMGDFNDIGIRGNFEQSGLSDTIPPCYNPRREGEGNPGWSKSYEDGGKRLANRKFPFLCFDHETDLQRCSKVWIAAKNIQPYDADGYNQKYRILAEDIRQWHKPAPSTNQGEQLSPQQSERLPTRKNYQPPFVEEEPRETQATGNDDHFLSRWNCDHISISSSSSQSRSSTLHGGGFDEVNLTHSNAMGSKSTIASGSVTEKECSRSLNVYDIENLDSEVRQGPKTPLAPTALMDASTPVANQLRSPTQTMTTPTLCRTSSPSTP